MIRQGIDGDALGLDMYEAQRDGEELPRVDAALPAGLEQLQELINEMTSFYPQSRPLALDVQAKLHTINSKVTATLNYCYSF